MTEHEIQTEIDKIANETSDKIAKLQAAKAKIKSAEAEALAEAERLTGKAHRRAKRQAAVDHFNQQMRPNHEQTMQVLGARLQDWRAQFIESFNQFLSVAAEYGRIEQEYDHAVTALYQDCCLPLESDKDLGAGWDMEDYYRQIDQISGLAHFGKPLDGLPQKALAVGGVKSGFDRLTMQRWIGSTSSTANQERLQAILDGLEIDE